MNKQIQHAIRLFFIDKKKTYLGIDKIHQEMYSKNLCVVREETIKQLEFLIENGELYKDEVVQGSPEYRLTKWGELKEGCIFNRAWYWLLYRKHNLGSLIAIAALVISILPYFKK